MRSESNNQSQNEQQFPDDFDQLPLPPLEPEPEFAPPEDIDQPPEDVLDLFRTPPFPAKKPRRSATRSRQLPVGRLPTHLAVGLAAKSSRTQVLRTHHLAHR